MSGKRAKRLMEEARKKSLDGSVIKSYYYKGIKKRWVNPHYAPVTVAFTTKPGTEIEAKRKQPQLVTKKLLGK